MCCFPTWSAVLIILDIAVTCNVHAWHHARRCRKIRKKRLEQGFDARFRPQFLMIWACSALRASVSYLSTCSRHNRYAAFSSTCPFWCSFLYLPLSPTHAFSLSLCLSLSLSLSPALAPFRLPPSMCIPPPLAPLPSVSLLLSPSLYPQEIEPDEITGVRLRI